MPCSSGMRSCRRDCLHRALVEDYRAARDRDERRRDVETIGYRADEQLYAAETPLVTFGSWLAAIAGSGIYSREQPPAEWEPTG